MMITVWISGASAESNDPGEDIIPYSVTQSESVTAFGTLLFDSGWYNVGVSPDPFTIVFPHNIGGNPDDYLVNLECWDNSTLSYYNCTDNGFNINAHWYGLTNSSINVWVLGGGIRPDQIRVRIYTKASIYNSGGRTIGIRPDPISVSFPLSFGYKINLDNLVIKLDCQDDTTLGTYDCTNQNFDIDAHWYDMDLTDIKVYIEKGSRPDAVRVRFFSAIPAYNSDWHTIGIRPDPLPIPFIHNLGGNQDEYIVKLDCKDDTELKTYDCTNQLFNQSAHWYGMTNTNINLWISGGSVPDEVRVRIWRQDQTIYEKIYLPLVMDNYSCGGT
jgi:hypothetical protein